jgi:Bacteriophage lambda head decoration protein D
MDIRAAERVRLTLAGNQAVNQSGALTPTTLPMGSCLGLVSATGKAVLLDSTRTDGANVLAAVLARDTETANGDVVVIAYITGSFLASKLLFGGTDTVNTHFSRFTGKAIAAGAIFVEWSTAEPTSGWSSS